MKPAERVASAPLSHPASTPFGSERGHTFGLNHVSESGHGNLTMSTQINGPCQLTERTLGRGNVLGLDKKYP